MGRLQSAFGPGRVIGPRVKQRHCDLDLFGEDDVVDAESIDLSSEFLLAFNERLDGHPPVALAPPL